MSLKQAVIILVAAAAFSYLHIFDSIINLLSRQSNPSIMKLYGFPFSTCTQRVAMVLREKEVPYELIPIDLSKGEHKNKSFTDMQPFGQVPVLMDGDLTIFESRAIARYVATKYADRGASLIPPTTDLIATAKFEQAASIEQSNFDVYASGIASERIFKPARGGETNQEIVEYYSTTLASKLDVYEVILAKQKYLAGDNVTLADLFHLPYGALITQRLGYDLLTSKARPNVARWWEDISSRSSWLSVKNGVVSKGD